MYSTLTKFDLFMIKFFSVSKFPAEVVAIDAKNPWIECQLPNWNRFEVNPNNWVIKKLHQKVLIDTSWGTRVYQPITDTEYDYLLS